MPDDVFGAVHARTRSPARGYGGVRGAVLRCAAVLLLAGCGGGETEGGGRALGLADLGGAVSPVDDGGVVTPADVAGAATPGDSGVVSPAADSGVVSPADDAGIVAPASGGRPSRKPKPSPTLGRYPRPGRGDVDCRDLRYAVRVDGTDPYTLDIDRDGVGCEPYVGQPIQDSARL